MSISASTILDRIVVSSDGVITGVFLKSVQNGDISISKENHIVTFSPGADVDERCNAASAQLSALGFTAIPGEDVQKIKTISAVYWTDDILTAFRAKAESAQPS